jgi:hypothetical protein
MKTTPITKKYQIDAILTVNYIKQNYGLSQFRHDDIMPFYLQKEIAPIVLYNLRMANLLLQKERGVYIASPEMMGLSDNAIAEKVRLSVSKNNKLKNAVKRDKNQKLLNSKMAQTSLEIQLTEKNAIEFLKSKGYRVLKPVSQYEEV